jgi:hypothetical protein
VTREGEETEASETAPISEVMKQLGLVMTEGTVDEGTSSAEAEQADIEEENADEEGEDFSILIPSKTSHLYFEKSVVSVTPRVPQTTRNATELHFRRPYIKFQQHPLCKIA